MPFCHISGVESPKTLQQAIQYFSDEQTCINAVAAMRWSDGPQCPNCEGDKGQGTLLPQDPEALEMSHLPQAVLRQGRHDLRGKPDPFAKVAPCFVDVSQLQEWNLLLRNSPRSGRIAKDRVVHAPSPESRAQIAESRIQDRRRTFRSRSR